MKEILYVRKDSRYAYQKIRGGSHILKSKIPNSKKSG